MLGQQHSKRQARQKVRTQGRTLCKAALHVLQQQSGLLKPLFLPPPQVPKDDSKRVITFANSNDYIAFRHHTYSKPAGTKSITLTECGPR